MRRASALGLRALRVQLDPLAARTVTSERAIFRIVGAAVPGGMLCGAAVARAYAPSIAARIAAAAAAAPWALPSPSRRHSPHRLPSVASRSPTIAAQAERRCGDGARGGTAGTAAHPEDARDGPGACGRHPARRGGRPSRWPHSASDRRRRARCRAPRGCGSIGCVAARGPDRLRWRGQPRAHLGPRRRGAVVDSSKV